MGTVPVGARPAAWAHGRWTRTDTGRAHNVVATYSNKYYNNTSTTTQQGGTAWYAHMLPRPTAAASSSAGSHTSVSMLTFTDAPARTVTSTYTAVLSAGTTTLEGQRTYSAHLAGCPPGGKKLHQTTARR